MKKFGIVLAVIIVIALVIVGVVFLNRQSTEPTAVVEDNKDASQEAESSEDVYVFDDNGKKLTLGAEYSSLDLGEPNDYYEVQSCAFDGMDKIYTYDHYEIRTYPDGETDKVASIYFLDEQVQTQEGVKIGDSFETMVEKYGENYENLDAKYIYTKEKTQINFIITDNAITSIEYTYITD